VTSSILDDVSDLQRFLDAQLGVYERALAELRRGQKTSHWMWFVFPQVEGLGFSAMSQRYAITSLDEAGDYLAHPVLGARLRECARALLAVDGRSAEQIMGGIDAVKLRSSMTLFHRAAPHDTAFADVLQRYFAGVPDDATDERLRHLGGTPAGEP
jgi:uncharacterized protein (DUF1810 family)